MSPRPCTHYADVVVDAIGDADDVIVVGQSFGAFTAPLVADRLPTSRLVLVAGMVPSPGEPPESTGGPKPGTPRLQENKRPRTAD